MEVKIVKLSPDAIIPTRGSEGSAGYDIYASSHPSFSTAENGVIQVRYETGIAMEIPKGYFGQIAPRSSIFKTYLRQVNPPGVIDSDYRGHIGFNFDYIGPEDYLSEGRINRLLEVGKLYSKGDRIGQLILVPYASQEFKLVTQLNETTRGSGGFGSTGK